MDTTQLCAPGSILHNGAFTTTPEGWFSWVCDGTPGRTNKACWASNLSTYPDCGPANGETGHGRFNPPLNSRLCTLGTYLESDGSSSLEYAGGKTWDWTCYDKASNQVDWCGTPDNAVPLCGSSNNDEIIVDTAPTTNLCARGVATSVEYEDMPDGSAWWYWHCGGCYNYQGVPYCYDDYAVWCGVHAPGNVPASSPAACGSANGYPTDVAPQAGLCAIGDPSSVTGGGPWEWTCSQGDSSAVGCDAPLPGAGRCGDTSGTTIAYKPNHDLCYSGSASTVAGSGPWTWICQGGQGGSNSGTCSADVCRECTGSIAGSVPHSYTRSLSAQCTGTTSWGGTDMLSGTYPTARISWSDKLGPYSQDVKYDITPTSDTSLPYCLPCYKVEENISNAKTVVSSGASCPNGVAGGTTVTPTSTPAITYVQ